MANITNKDLKRRIIEISYKYHLSHIGSCLTAVDIIDEIYQIRKQNEPFILSSGHAGLALYVVLESRYGIDAEYLFRKHGVHPNRDIDNQIWCSSGSLGHGLGIAVGMAFTDRNKNVYCLISDGECAEGSIWEALRIAAENRLENLRVYNNVNRLGAYRSIDSTRLWKQFSGFHMDKPEIEDEISLVSHKLTNLSQWPIWIQGLAGHYVVMDEQRYKEALEVLNETT